MNTSLESSSNAATPVSRTSSMAIKSAIDICSSEGFVRPFLHHDREVGRVRYKLKTEITNGKDSTYKQNKLTEPSREPSNNSNDANVHTFLTLYPTIPREYYPDQQFHYTLYIWIFHFLPFPLCYSQLVRHPKNRGFHQKSVAIQRVFKDVRQLINTNIKPL